MNESEPLSVDEFTDLIETALLRPSQSPTRYQSIQDRIADVMDVAKEDVNVSYITGGSQNFRNRFGQAGFKRAAILGVGLLDDPRHIPDGVEFVRAGMIEGSFPGSIAVGSRNEDGRWQLEAIVEPLGRRVDVSGLPLSDSFQRIEMSPPGAPQDLSSLIERVLAFQESWSSVNTPEMSERGQLVRTHAPALIEPNLSFDDALAPGDLAVEGRDGTGKKTRVPWFRVYSKTKSPHATDGWYVVYLFDFEGRTAYLSLNQGTTDFQGKAYVPKPTDQIAARVQFARQLLADHLSDNRLVSSIALNDPGSLGTAYEAGHVTGFAYPRERIPDDEQLFGDLNQLLHMLFEVLHAEDTETPLFEPEPIDLLTLELIHNHVTERGLFLDESTIRSALAALLAGKNLLLIGPPGTGKTEFSIALSEAATEAGVINGWVPATGTSDWTTADTVGGYWLEKDQHLRFRRGQALRSIDEIKWLLIDELNRADIDKALGQFFTVLSGQPVVLPFIEEVEGREDAYASIVPHGATIPSGTHAHRVHPNWRMIATLNDRDQDLLFDMSYALMRRFAVVQVPNPSSDLYKNLLRARADTESSALNAKLEALINLPHRPPGPALLIDCGQYLESRLQLDAENEIHSNDDLIGEAILAFIVPQLSGLTTAQVREVVSYLGTYVVEDVERIGGIVADALQIRRSDIIDTAASGADEPA